MVVSEEGDSKSPAAHPPCAAIASDRASLVSEPPSDTALQPGAVPPTQAGTRVSEHAGAERALGLEIFFLPSHCFCNTAVGSGCGLCHALSHWSQEATCFQFVSEQDSDKGQCMGERVSSH